MPLKIVYIDDEVDLCMIFQDHLSNDQILIKTFTDPEKAILDMELNTPDLVFIDFRLPNTTGEEIAKKIKDSIPKVLVSGDIFKRPMASFVRIISKPFDFEEVKNIINDFQKKSSGK